MSQVVTDIERGRRDVGAVGFLGPEEPSLVENSAVISGGPEALAGPEAHARDEAASASGWSQLRRCVDGGLDAARMGRPR